MDGASLGRPPSKNHLSFSAQEAEKYFKIRRFHANRAYKAAKDNRYLF